MKLNINLQDDAELRKEVMTLIKGQVEAIMREDIKQIVIETMDKDKKTFSSARLEEMAKNSISAHVAKFCSENVTWVGDRNNPDNKKLNNMILAEVRSIVKSDKVDEYITKYIESTIERIVPRTFEDIIDKKVKDVVMKILAGVLIPQELLSKKEK